MARQGSATGELRRAAQSLRVRLTAGYVLLFALVLTSVGLIFREALAVTLQLQNEQLLAEEWTTLRGYLRVQDGELAWVFRPDEPDEAYAVERLRRVLMLAEPNGEVLEISNGYSGIGPETRAQIQKVARAQGPVVERRVDRHGDVYLVRMGLLRDEGKEYFLALGMPAEPAQRVPDRLITVYFLMMPVMLLAIGVMGWHLTDRALRPLAEVTAAVQEVAGGNLGLRIAARRTGDELDRLIQTFNGMMNRLEENFQRMRRFSVDASHELRTPLTALRGQLEVGLLTARSQEQYRAAIETALEDVERLVEIVNGLLSLAEAESGQVKLKLAEADLRECVEKVLAQYQPAAQQKRIRLKLAAGARMEGRIDREQFERLFSQLVSNAVKFTPEGGTVEASVGSDGRWMRVRLCDDGPGIGESHLGRIFERFYRIREGAQARAGGAGLGLTLASWIAGAHGGRIEVKSEPGKGSTFEVVLPDPAGRG